MSKVWKPTMYLKEDVSNSEQIRIDAHGFISGERERESVHKSDSRVLTLIRIQSTGVVTSYLPPVGPLLVLL